MAKKLTQIVGEHDYNDIFASTYPAAIVGTATIAAPATGAKRGTVLVRGDGGKYAPIAAALDSTSVVAILADEVEPSDADVVASIYKGGNFVRGKLATDGSYALAASDYAYLRQAGFQSEDAIN